MNLINLVNLVLYIYLYIIIFYNQLRDFGVKYLGLGLLKLIWLTNLT